MLAIVVANAPAIPIRDVNMPAVMVPALPRLTPIVHSVLADIAAVLAPAVACVAAMVPPIFTGVAPMFAPITNRLVPTSFALMVLGLAFVAPNVPFLMSRA